MRAKNQMDRFRNQTDLDASLIRLSQLDPALAPFVASTGSVFLRQRPEGLKGLFQIIFAQQVSVASASAITKRFEQEFPDLDPQVLAETPLERLQSCGLSRPKIRTVHAISRALLDGFDLEGLSDCEPEQTRQSLVSLHGVGPWTAEVYMLFCLGFVDVFPAGDLALQEAGRVVLGLETRPSSADMAKFALERWSPERGAAAHLLWAVYRDMKQGRDGVL